MCKKNTREKNLKKNNKYTNLTDNYDIYNFKSSNIYIHIYIIDYIIQ